MLKLDHVVYGVADLDQAGRHLLATAGLASVAGGRHPGWGTGNRIAPLGDSYLEMLAVVDPTEAALDPVGGGFARLLAGGDRPLLWVLATDDLEGVASRLGLAVRAKSRQLPGGGRIAWRSAGIEAALANPALPFFITREGAASEHPGRIPCAHPAQARDIAWVGVGADPAELAEWLGGQEVPVRIGGAPGVNAVGITTPTGEITLR